MPIYEYECPGCGCEFEELVTQKDSDNGILPCKKCGADAVRKMSRFSSVVSGGSSNETVDMSIGREAEKRWQMHTDIQAERQKGKKIETLNLPKDSDGKFMPVMGLGDKAEQSKRQEYTSALQEHRVERAKKGQPQFSEAGAF